MTTLAEHLIVARAENHPSMLKKSITKLQDVCDVQATNIILHSLPPYVYALVNHQEVAKDIWDRVKLLMKGTELSYHKLQVNTKHLNALPSKWSKFVTDVKLAKSLYTTNYDQLYAYLSQHERHAIEVRIMREIYLDPLALVANSPTLYNPSQSPQHLGKDLIECINKAMAFLSAVASRFPPLKNELRTSSNLRNQATIQDASQPRVVKCYNCQREGHMTTQCTQPKRPRNAAWFKEKLINAYANETISFYDDTHKQALGYQNPFHLKKAQRIQPTLYDGSVIAKEHAVISMIDDEETFSVTRKGTVIRKLKDRIKSLSRKDSLENVKKDIDEIETINIELEHSVAKLLSKNENLRKEREQLRSIYKDQFDSIRKTHVQFSKAHDDSLIDQINAKSVENSNLNAQLQGKGRTFTIVGNKCPLTRITSTKVVLTKETSTKSVATPTQGILVYSRRPKATRSVGSSSKVKIVESKTSNSKEPKQSWGSTVFDVPSSSLNDYRLSKLFDGIWTLAAQSI
ncbi:copia protein [Tanacetum coccineum]|uniref:Copia protein n=1 Tax=Tanacetum coccineum TaxID=301880 RepID=A0ABQ5A8A9_9ASTR